MFSHIDAKNLNSQKLLLAKKSLGRLSKKHSVNYILFFCYVINDGFGDLGHLIDIASPLQLRKADFPENHTPLYCIAVDKSKHTFERVKSCMEKYGDFIPNEAKDFSEVNNPNIHFIFYQEDLDTQTFLTYIKNNAHFREQLQDVCAEIQISTDFFRITYDVENNVDRDKYLHYLHNEKIKRRKITNHLTVGEHSPIEHDNVDSIFVQDMGFRDTEFGLLLSPERKIDRQEELKSITQPWLLDALGFQDAKITDENTKYFLDEVLFIPGYIQDAAIFANMLHGVASSILVKEKGYKEIIFFVTKDIFKRELIEPDLLEANISRLEFKFFDENGHCAKKDDMFFTPNGIPLKIISCAFLRDQYETLFRIAPCIGGCSGDKTLENVINKLLLPLPHIRNTKYELYLALKDRIPSSASELKKYLTMCIALFHENDELDENEIKELEAHRREHIKEFQTIFSSKVIEEWRTIMAPLLFQKYNFYDHWPKFLLQHLAVQALCQITEEELKQSRSDWQDCLTLLSLFNNKEKAELLRLRNLVEPIRKVIKSHLLKVKMAEKKIQNATTQEDPTGPEYKSPSPS